MNNLNTVLVEGKLVRDPFVKEVSAEYIVCRMAIANNRYYIKDGKWEEDTSFFSIVVYGNVAALCGKYLRKGRGIRVVGRLKQYRDISKDPLMPREQVWIIAEHIEFQPEKQVQPMASSPDRIPRGANDATFSGSIQEGIGRNGETIPVDECAENDECATNNECTLESADEKEQEEIQKENGENVAEDSQPFDMSDGSPSDEQAGDNDGKSA